MSKRDTLITLCVGVLAFLAVFLSRTSRLNSSSAMKFEEPYELILKEKISLEALIDSLHGDLPNFSSEQFFWAARLLGWNQYQPGRYYFSGNYSYEDFVAKMGRGIQDPVDIVIRPGISIGDFSVIVSEHIRPDSSEIADLFEDSLAQKKFRLSKELLFGRMLPETYKIYWNSSPEQVVERLLEEFNDRIVEKNKSRLDSLKYSVDEVLTLASIVEWEANIEDEKKRVSGLYWNRLDKNMLLQADPTINYALGERRRVLFEDYRIDHPFNTYQNRGLPPGPITNPSEKTILATLYPEDHDFLYMVASPEGGHTFTRTFEDHKRESEKWRKWLREQYRIKRQRERENNSD